ncbi:hypothetical protein GCM10029964_059270 [Kibdelosporangium lantanae]
MIAHRDWFARTITDVFTGIGEELAEPAARHFVLLRDGAMATGCLTDPEPVCETFIRGVDGLIRNQERRT